MSRADLCWEWGYQAQGWIHEYAPGKYRAIGEILIDDAFDRVKGVLQEKGRTISEQDLRTIAVGAIKYAYLAQDREKDVVFDPDKALALDGISGPYVQYAQCTREADIEAMQAYEG